MSFSVVVYDEWCFHIREIYVCEWDYELLATKQTLIAYGVFSTKWFSDRWVRKALVAHLQTNGKITIFNVKP